MLLLWRIIKGLFRFAWGFVRVVATFLLGIAQVALAVIFFGAIIGDGR